MSEKRRTTTTTKLTFEDKSRLLQNYLQLQEEIREHEALLKKKRERSKRLLAQHPYLGNVVGLLRKETKEEEEPQNKKAKIASSTSSTSPGSTSAPSPSARERIRKVIAQKQGETSRAEKSTHQEQLRAASQDKF